MPEVKYYEYALTLKKSNIPLMFIDTFFWKTLFKQSLLRELLERCCKMNKILIVITNLLKGELINRGIFEKINDVCGDNLICVPTGRITANQIIHAMIAYKEKLTKSQLSWETSISEVPPLKSQENLKNAVGYFRDELNKLKSDISSIHGRNKRRLIISMLTGIELEFWKDTLKIYGDLLKLNGEEYDQFFYTNYFLDLPSIVFQVYLMGYTLSTTNIKTQDVVDIFNISEIIPYTAFSVIDKVQHQRLMELARDYPILFDPLFKHVYITSKHKRSPNIEENLKSFLKWCIYKDF